MSNSDYYQYVPSIPPAAAGVAVFALSTVLHLWQAYSIKAWFCFGIVIGGQMEAIGYFGRILSHNNGHSLILYLMQSVTIIQAPVFFGMAISSTLCRLMTALNGEDLSIIRINYLTKLFMVADALGLLLQTSGAGLSAKESTEDIAGTIVIVGLGFQLASLVLFSVGAVIFYLRMRERLVPSGQSKWTTLLYVLGIAASLIFVRTVFRMAEFAGGKDGVLAKKELYLYVYDALLMAGVMAIFHFYHPGKMLARLTRAKEENQSLGELLHEI